MDNNNGNNPNTQSDAQFSSVSPAYETVTVDKLTYILLAFFLGAFGAHKFYAGQVKEGIIYLLMLLFSFLVIPGIVVTILAIYELIVAMMVNDNGDGKITLKKGFVLTKPN